MATNPSSLFQYPPSINKPMDWEKLLCSNRLDGEPPKVDAFRSPYDKDYDKLVFSKTFRRLGRKTQVHPLATNDHVHNRLSHSIEVAAVGRSLGRAIGEYVLDNHDESLGERYTRDEFGAIVQAACLAHDLGNPPFGHAGEKAIRQWMHENSSMLSGLSAEQQTDLKLFEGNAQGFRIATQHSEAGGNGSLGLTAATLGAMTKYPWHSNHFKALKKEKFSVFQSEAKEFQSMAEMLGLILIKENDNRVDGSPEYNRFCRHPLVYLVEAADDICNTIIDIEDAVELDILRFTDVKHELMKLRGKDRIEKESITVHRAEAISHLVEACCTVFEDNYIEIMRGEEIEPLIKLIPKKQYNAFMKLKSLAVNKVYPVRRNIELELGCYSSLSTLLDSGMTAALNKNSGTKAYKQSNLLALVGEAISKDDIELYDRYMLVTDFVSGMTDNYATYIAAQLSGYAR